MPVTNDEKRAVAITLKNRVNELYDAIYPIFKVVNVWNLNNADLNLPSGGRIKAQVLAYEAIYKEPIRLMRELREIKSADIEVEPEALLMDGSWQFSNDYPVIF